MKSITLNLAFLIVVLTVASCGEDDCAFKFCDQPDIDYINALSFSFDEVTPQSQVETAYLVRFNKDDDFLSPIDSIRYLEATDGAAVLVLSDKRPFTSGGFINLNSYEDSDYIIRNTTGDFIYKLSDIEVKGEYSDCDCIYTNTQKTFNLNNQEMDRTNSDAIIVLKP